MCVYVYARERERERSEMNSPHIPLTPEYVHYLVERTVAEGRCPQISHSPGGGEELRAQSEHEEHDADAKRIKLEC